MLRYDTDAHQADRRAIRSVSPRQGQPVPEQPVTVAELKPDDVQVVSGRGTFAIGRRRSPAASSSHPSKCCRRRAATRQKTLDSIRLLKDAGVDGVNIPDGPRAQTRMSAQATAVLVEREIGIEAVLHYCCRDRNLLGMMSRPARGGGARAAQSADHHRRPAEDGPVSGRDRRLRHRRDRISPTWSTS